jgi:hypothetical protein
MDIDDVPNSGQPMSTGKKLLAKQKPKVLPDELLARVVQQIMPSLSS